MIPVIPSLLILYYTGKTFSLFYFTLNFILALVVYYKATKYYFPDMKNINDQYFHENYKTFERDELHKISILKIYHGLLNYFWFKAFWSAFFLAMIWVGIRVIFFGKKEDYHFTPEDRRKVLAWNKFVAKGIYTCCGVVIDEIDLSKDEKVINIMRKYLGKDYVPEEKYSTVIGNHVSWADILYIEKKFSPSFIAKDSVKQIPFVGLIAWGQKSSFIARKDKNAIEKTKEFINIKQKEVFEGKDYFPLAIYPEGTTTNGKYIISFKQGPFYNLYPTKSVLFNVNNHKTCFPICASAMDILLHIVLTMTFLFVKMEAFELPVFAPNDYLYENFKHLGKDKHSIYSEAVRLVWSEVLNRPLNSGNLDVKLEYKSKIKKKPIKDT